MILGRNTEKIVDIILYDKDTKLPIDISTIEVVEFSFGLNDDAQVRKYYKASGEGDVFYNASEKVFKIHLTQQDTIQWTYARLPVQLRVKFVDGTVDSTDTKPWNVRQALSDEVI